MKQSPKVLLVGATGYLGLQIVEQLRKDNYHFLALVRNKQKLLDLGLSEANIIQAQVTEPATLVGICNGVDIVISCLGITRQRDGLKYMDVDYQANMNLLLEAEKSGVTKFVYVSAFNAQKYTEVRMLQAKEKFAARLLSSNKLLPCVIRPNGFFSDLEEIYQMAIKGKVYLLGTGATEINPIHGEDLAKYCLEALTSQDCELDVGGPETLSMQHIAKLAFEAQGKKPVIVNVPDKVRRIVLWIMKRLPQKWGGAAEFFLTALASDAKAPEYGLHKIGDHYVSMSFKK